MLCAAYRFHMDDGPSDRTTANEATWMDQDPLGTSRVVVRVQPRIVALASNTENADSTGNSVKLRAHHESRLFKCEYLWCARSLRGFETKHDLQNHKRSHQREWQRSAPTCPSYATHFLTESMLKEHTQAMSKHHLEAAVTLPSTDIRRQDTAGLKTLSVAKIHCLVEQTQRNNTTDDVDTLSRVQQLCPLPSWMSQRNKDIPTLGLQELVLQMWWTLPLMASIMIIVGSTDNLTSEWALSAIRGAT